MTDFQRFIELLQSFGFKSTEKSVWCLGGREYLIQEYEGKVSITIGSGSGYGGFHHNFEFTNGKFTDHAGLE